MDATKGAGAAMLPDWLWLHFSSPGVLDSFLSVFAAGLLVLWLVLMAKWFRGRTTKARGFGEKEESFLRMMTKVSSGDLPANFVGFDAYDADKAGSARNGGIVSGSATAGDFSNLQVDAMRWDEDRGQGMNLLMYASVLNCPRGVDVLLKQNADPLQTNEKGRNALNFFAENDQVFMIKSVFRRLDEPDQDRLLNGKTLPMFRADVEEPFLEILAQEGDVDEEEFREWVDDRGLRVNSKAFFVTSDGEKSTTTYSLLQYAAYHRRPQAMKMLLEEGADPFWRNNRGSTVMQFLAKRGLLKMAKTLLEHVSGPPESKVRLINQGNISNWTPLMSALENGNLLFAEWMMHNGADVNAAMDTGWTALMVVSKRLDEEGQEAVIRMGANHAAEGNHRDYGTGARASEVREQAARRKRIRQEKEAETAGKVARLRPEQQRRGRRALVAMATFFDSEDLAGDTGAGSDIGYRPGAELDERLGKTFGEAVDCAVEYFVPTVDKEGRRRKKTRAEFNKFVSSVQALMRSDRFGILVFVLSSHGGEDGRGQFFCDEDGRRVYLRESLENKFCRADEEEGLMRDKVLVLVPNICRVWMAPAEEEEKAAGEQQQQQQQQQQVAGLGPADLTARQTRSLVVQVTTRGDPSFRSVRLGSLPLVALRDAVQNFAPGYPMQDIVAEADHIMQGWPIPCAGGNLVHQGFRTDSTPGLEPIYFRAPR